MIDKLLHIANSNPVDKSEFYALKDKILKRHGKHTGYQVQHIKKICWGCDGTGIFEGFTSMGFYRDVPPQTCRQCGGSGVFTEFWVLLECWELGKYSFHRPTLRTHNSNHPMIAKYAAGELFGSNPMIEGYINHRNIPYKLVNRCFYILLFLFDLRGLFKLFGRKIWLWFRRVFRWRPGWYRAFKLRNISDDLPF